MLPQVQIPPLEGEKEMIHPHSREAYQELDLGKRQRLIIEIYKERSCPLTDRQVLSWIFGVSYSDMNKVRPRITELIDKGVLEEKGKTTCAITGRTVRLVGLKQPEAF